MIFGLDCADVESTASTSWSLAKANGPISFAIIRAAYGKTADVSFQTSWPAIKAVGITRGAYLFLRFPKKGSSAPPDPKTQAQAFVNTVGPLDHTDFPPVIDVEFPGNGRKDTGLTPTQALAWVRSAWRALASAYSVTPIIYTSARVWSEDLNNIAAGVLARSPLWLARYFYGANTTAVRDPVALGSGFQDPPVPPPWGDAGNWWIHQFQGDAIGLPGFARTVDMDRFNTTIQGAKGDLVKWMQGQLGIAQSGTFDAALTKRVIGFQAAKGLVADGIVGPKTFVALCWNQPRPQ